MAPAAGVPDQRAVGATLAVAGTDFTVVGVLENLSLGFGGGGGGGGGGPAGGGQGGTGGQAGGPGFQVAIYLPAQFVMDLAGTDNVSQIIAASGDPATVEPTVERIEVLMLERHGVQDFRVDSIAELLESFTQTFGVLTGFRGLIGLLLAWVGVAALGDALGIEAGLSAGIVALALGVSVGIGVFFGVAPAWRAARMDPITALRHE